MSAAIGIGTTRSPSSEEKNAYRAVMKASYIETGADKRIKALEKIYIPKELKKYGAWITGTTRLVADKKISFEWTF